MEKLIPIDEIIDMEIMDYVKKKLGSRAVLGGRRALALAGITFKRSFDGSDHDFIIKHLGMRHTIFGDGTFREMKKNEGGYNMVDAEYIPGRIHYRFHRKTDNCLFVNPDLITTTYRGIKIADPEQILFYKKKYIETSEKHRKDFERMSRLHYTLGHL